MKILATRITNFRSFRGVQEFVFPDKYGLYFMQGVNAAEPRLGANGAGKSTLWEALTWCLYGKTSRGLKSGDAANWEAGKATAVEIDFVQGLGEISTLRRTWGPISWTLDGEDIAADETNPLLGALRLEFAPWLHCVLMAQGQPMFLDMKAEAKAELFSEVMGLDHWLTASERAGERARAMTPAIAEVHSQRDELEGRRIEVRYRDHRRAADDFEAAREAKLASIKAEYTKLAAQESSWKTELEAKSAEEKELRAKLDQQAAADDAARTQADFSESARVASQERVRSAFAEVVRLKKIIEHTGECPFCEQSIGANHRAKLEAALASAREHENQCAAELKRDHDQANRDRHALDSQRVGLRATDDAVKACKTQRVALEERIHGLVRTFSLFEAQARDTEAEVNPHAELETRARDEEARLEAEISEASDQLDELQAQQNRYGFWVRGFKDIRLREIGEALAHLEVEVNSSVMALGLVDWSLRFDVDAETKAGTVKRGFAVKVLSPHNDRAVPWEAWSGGEGQRLRLATTMGLSNLIRQRTGCPLDLEVWDEPTAWMSAEGVEDLLECLKRRSADERRQIWVVDHRSLGYGAFEGVRTVRKTDKGSSFDD